MDSLFPSVIATLEKSTFIDEKLINIFFSLISLLILTYN